MHNLGQLILGILLSFHTINLVESNIVGTKRIEWAYPRWNSKDFDLKYTYWPYHQQCTEGESFPQFVSNVDLFHRNRPFARAGNPFENFRKLPHRFFTILEPTEKKFIGLTHRSSPNSVHDMSYVLFVPMGFLVIYTIMAIIGFFVLPFIFGGGLFALCCGIIWLVRRNFIRKIGRSLIVGRELYNRQRHVYYAGHLKNRRTYDRKYFLSPFWRNPDEGEVPIVLNEALGAPSVDLQAKTSVELDIAKETKIIKEKALVRRKTLQAGIAKDFANPTFELIDELDEQKTEGKVAFMQKVPFEPDRASLRFTKEQNEEKRTRLREKKDAEKRRDLRRAREAAAQGKHYERRGSNESDYSSTSSTPPEAVAPLTGFKPISEAKSRKKPISIATGKQKSVKVGLKNLETVFDKGKSRHAKKNRSKANEMQLTKEQEEQARRETVSGQKASVYSARESRYASTISSSISVFEFMVQPEESTKTDELPKQEKPEEKKKKRKCIVT